MLGARHIIRRHAFVVRGAQGQEIARFTETGNVLLMKEGAHVVPEVTAARWATLSLPSATGHEFIVRDGAGDYRAIIPEDGNLYLTGNVITVNAGEVAPGPNNGGTAFIIRREGVAVSLIDDAGNLVLSGYVLEDGIPRDLPKNDPDDKYSRW